MQVKSTNRGFRIIKHPSRTQRNVVNEPEMTRLIQESSAIGDYKNSLSEPGSSYLWIGDDHHLNREEVAELIDNMQHWLDDGRLPSVG